MNFDEMLLYVLDILEKNNARISPRFSFRDRYTHILRVLSWAKELSVQYKEIDLDVLYTACIFHDAGYAFGKKDHHINSDIIFKKYAINFDNDFVNKVSYLILNHSDKTLLKTTNNVELITLLEADLLDEEGAMGIMWDLMAAGKNNCNGYLEGYKEIFNHSGHILEQDFMVSDLAKKIWNEKKQFVEMFLKQIKHDLFIGD